MGWRLPFLTDKVKAIVAYEPGGTPFIFPENEVPDSVETTFPLLKSTAIGVPMNEFIKLTKVPIVIYYGDYIPTTQVKEVGPDKWRSEYEMAKKFVSIVNKYGGDATIVHLPEIGIKGNSHFLMGEKNNHELADLVEKWLEQKGLNN